MNKVNTKERILLSVDISASFIGFFGAICVLAFGVWDSPLSQPRNIIRVHVISASVKVFLEVLLLG